MAATISEISIGMNAAEYSGSAISSDIIRVVNREPDIQKRGLISMSRRDSRLKPLLVALANSGYYLYRVTEQFSGFIHHDSIGKRKKLMRDGELKLSGEGILYSVEPPLDDVADINLLVIFSTMKASSNLLTRHFLRNFSKISKYIPRNTAILRIGDLGSVKGAFYLNTNYLPRNEDNIQKLIRDVSSQLGAKRVLLYGASKGGTASLYHAIVGGYMAIAADPILSDEYYLSPKMNDVHFTMGTFPERKEEKFRRLFHENRDRIHDGISVVYSSRSHQFAYINAIMADPYPDMATYYNSTNVNIKDHPDVAPFTLPLIVSLMSTKLYGLPIARGKYEIS